jgi:ABC-type phosphate transport system substrate-binding protein
MKMKFTFFVLLCLLVAGSACAEGQIVVITNRDSSVEKIDADQATQIFLKQVQTWPDGKAIQPIDLKEGSPLRTEFYSKVTGRSTGQLRAYWARQAFTGMGFPPRQVQTSEEVAKIVQATPGAIGYVGRKQADTNVKIVLDPER